MERQVLFLASIAVLAIACVADAIAPISASYVPFDRLITNTEAFIKDYPDDPQGYYTLARMHYFTFVNRMPLVPTRNPNGYPPNNVAPDWQVRKLPDQGSTQDYLDMPAVLAHAAAAVDNFERALDLDPENGLFYLGLASLYEQYSSYTVDVNVTDHPRQLASITVPKMRVTYYLAYRFAIEKEGASEYIPIMMGLKSFVSYEAGTAYLRLAEKEPSIADSNSVRRVRNDVEKLENLPWGGPITPIVFCIQEHGSVLDLLAPDTHVTFDLDGTGRKMQWPWVKPSTGLLVWDPQNRGEITSGRQLFGTATWWLLFPNGYAALDALDDNRDGSLSGAELRGIGVWFDKNANGRSDPGEVQPVADFGVQAIRTRSTGSDHGMPMNAQGILLNNGRTVPTYDWVVSPTTEDQR